MSDDQSESFDNLNFEQYTSLKKIFQTPRFKPKMITELNFSNENHSDIPPLKPLSLLSNLTTLILAKNHIKRFNAKDFVVNIPQLQVLDLSYNEITILDDIIELGILQNLNVLNIKDNPICNDVLRIKLVENLLFPDKYKAYEPVKILTATYTHIPNYSDQTTKSIKDKITFNRFIERNSFEIEKHEYNVSRVSKYSHKNTMIKLSLIPCPVPRKTRFPMLTILNEQIISKQDIMCLLMTTNIKEILITDSDKPIMDLNTKGNNNTNRELHEKYIQKYITRMKKKQQQKLEMLTIQKLENNYSDEDKDKNGNSEDKDLRLFANEDRQNYYLKKLQVLNTNNINEIWQKPADLKYKNCSSVISIKEYKKMLREYEENKKKKKSEKSKKKVDTSNKYTNNSNHNNNNIYITQKLEKDKGKGKSINHENKTVKDKDNKEDKDVDNEYGDDDSDPDLKTLFHKKNKIKPKMKLDELKTTDMLNSSESYITEKKSDLRSNSSTSNSFDDLDTNQDELILDEDCSSEYNNNNNQCPSPKLKQSKTEYDKIRRISIKIEKLDKQKDDMSVELNSKKSRNDTAPQSNFRRVNNNNNNPNSNNTNNNGVNTSNTNNTHTNDNNNTKEPLEKKELFRIIKKQESGPNLALPMYEKLNESKPNKMKIKQLILEKDADSIYNLDYKSTIESKFFVNSLGIEKPSMMEIGQDSMVVASNKQTNTNNIMNSIEIKMDNEKDKNNDLIGTIQVKDEETRGQELKESIGDSKDSPDKLDDFNFLRKGSDLKFETSGKLDLLTNLSKDTQTREDKQDSKSLIDQSKLQDKFFSTQGDKTNESKQDFPIGLHNDNISIVPVTNLNKEIIRSATTTAIIRAGAGEGIRPGTSSGAGISVGVGTNTGAGITAETGAGITAETGAGITAETGTGTRAGTAVGTGTRARTGTENGALISPRENMLKTRAKKIKEDEKNSFKINNKLYYNKDRISAITVKSNTPTKIGFTRSSTTRSKFIVKSPVNNNNNHALQTTTNQLATTTKASDSKLTCNDTKTSRNNNLFLSTNTRVNTLVTPRTNRGMFPTNPKNEYKEASKLIIDPNIDINSNNNLQQVTLEELMPTIKEGVSESIKLKILNERNEKYNKLIEIIKILESSRKISNTSRLINQKINLTTLKKPSQEPARTLDYGLLTEFLLERNGKDHMTYEEILDAKKILSQLNETEKLMGPKMTLNTLEAELKKLRDSESMLGGPNADNNKTQEADRHQDILKLYEYLEILEAANLRHDNYKNANLLKKVEQKEIERAGKNASLAAFVLKLRKYYSDEYIKKNFKGIKNVNIFQNFGSLNILTKNKQQDFFYANDAKKVHTDFVGHLNDLYEMKMQGPSAYETEPRLGVEIPNLKKIDVKNIPSIEELTETHLRKLYDKFNTHDQKVLSTEEKLIKYAQEFKENAKNNELLKERVNKHIIEIRKNIDEFCKQQILENDSRHDKAACFKRFVKLMRENKL